MPENYRRYKPFLSDAELRAFFESPETLPIQDTMILAMTPPQQNGRLSGLSFSFPDAPFKPQTMLWVDTTKRPDIRDLARVHATEGPGTTTFTWSYINENRLDCYFVFHVVMHTPVHASFRIPIFVREWYKLIDTISQTGSLSLLAGPPINWRELQTTLNSVELEATIHRQAGGGITLTFDDEMQRELRHHYENHVEAIMKRLGRG